MDVHSPHFSLIRIVSLIQQISCPQLQLTFISTTEILKFSPMISEIPIHFSICENKTNNTQDFRAEEMQLPF